MSDLSEVFCELIVTADVHEQANCEIKTRVLGLQKFVEERGGCFQIEHLGDGYGLDYKVEGNYKGKEISLGIEYKQFLNDFVPNHSTLEKRLGAAREHYDNIALVIEGEQLARTSRVVGDKNVWYTNPAVQDGAADQMMNKQMFVDRMQIWMESGVLVRNIAKEDEFPDMFLYLVEYVSKDDDWYSKHKIDLPNTSFKNQYINMILSLGIDKIGLKTAQKIASIYPNPYWLIVDGEDNLKDNIGKVTGGKLFNFFNNKDLITVEWQNGGNKAQLSKETEKSLKSNPEQSSEVIDNTVATSKGNVSPGRLKQILEENAAEIAYLKNPELAYLDEHKPVFKEVSRRTITNGKLDVKGLIPEDNALVIKYKPFVLGFLQHNPSGIKYEDIQRTLVDKMASNAENMFGTSSSMILEHIIHQLLTDGEIYEPKLGLLVATNPLQLSTPRGEHDSLPVQSLVSGSSQLSNDGKPYAQSAGSENQAIKHPSDNPASQTLAGAGSRDGESTCPSQMANVKGLDAGRQVAKAKAEDYAGSNPAHPANLPDAPSNDEFKANPRMKDIVEFIRRHPRTLDDVSTEFGLSREYTFNALNELKNQKKIWFNKASLCFEFGLDKNPAPVVAEKEMDIGV